MNELDAIAKEAAEMLSVYPHMLVLDTKIIRAAIDKALEYALTKEPSEGLLVSMAIRYDHGLGVPGYYDQAMFSASGISHAQRMASTISTMRQLYEEAMGQGFYKPEDEEGYRQLLEELRGNSSVTRAGNHPSAADESP